jgi:hypothetical protein
MPHRHLESTETGPKPAGTWCGSAAAVKRATTMTGAPADEDLADETTTRRTAITGDDTTMRTTKMIRTAVTAADAAGMNTTAHATNPIAVG